MKKQRSKHENLLITTFALVVLFVQVSSAQSTAELDFLPGDYCKPGVIHKSPSKGILVQYGLLPAYRFSNAAHLERDEPFEDINHRLNVKLKAPVFLKNHTKVLVGISHLRESYSFGNHLSDQLPADEYKKYHLRSTKLSAYGFHTWRSDMYLLARFAASYSGDYDQFINFGSRYAVYRGSLMLGIKKSENTEWGIGLMYTDRFFESSLPALLPFVMYNHTFNDKWGIESVLPVLIKLRRDLNEGNLLVFSTGINNNRYSVDQSMDANPQELQDFHFRDFSLQFSASLNHQFNKYLWSEMTIGFAQSLGTSLENPQNGQQFYSITPTGPYVSCSVFLAPPRH